MMPQVTPQVTPQLLEYGILASVLVALGMAAKLYLDRDAKRREQMDGKFFALVDNDRQARKEETQIWRDMVEAAITVNLEVAAALKMLSKQEQGASKERQALLEGQSAMVRFLEKLDEQKA